MRTHKLSTQVTFSSHTNSISIEITNFPEVPIIVWAFGVSDIAVNTLAQRKLPILMRTKH